MPAQIFYKPADGWLADVIPFYWDGLYHLFYLKDFRDTPGHGAGVPWMHLATRDFVTFQDLGEALPRGGDDAQDQYVYTGCVIEHNGLFHIFYTGHNETFRGTDRPDEAIMHATSTDLEHWTKDPANPILFAPTDRYERDDWRDPFVFWDPEGQEFLMLLAARRTAGPLNRRGCTAVVASPDLVHWEVRDPLWSPDLWFTHECPDLFRVGDDWVLLYSTFSERTVTHYRRSRTLAGPWLAPADDAFDTRAFYAAKTATDGQRRFLFGWLPSRTDEKDDGVWQWGGSLVVHELVESGGPLTVRPPQSVVDRFSVVVAPVLVPAIGDWAVDGDAASTQSPDGFAYLALGSLPDPGILEVAISLAPGTRSAGVILRADDALGHYYQLRVEPANRRIVFDRWPRPGDQPFLLERPLGEIGNGPIRLRIIVEGTAIVTYVDDRVALSARGYDVSAAGVGLFVAEGSAEFSEISIRRPT